MRADFREQPNSVFPRAFTLLEMMVTVAVLALVASSVVPLFREDMRLRVVAAANVLRSDIELAQTMTIAFPSDPVMVCFDVEDQMYWLAFSSTPATPIARSNDGEPYVVSFGQGRASSAMGVTFSLVDVTDDAVEFDPTGGLTDFTTTPNVVLELGSHAITLSITPMTGSIIETVGAIENK